MAQVYHDKEWNPNVRQRTFPDDFLLVAEVDTDNLEDIFRLANHIDSAWWDNPGVTHHAESRSTCSGDVVVKTDGSIHVCRSMGWTMVGSVSEQPVSFRSEIGVFDGQ